MKCTLLLMATRIFHHYAVPLAPDAIKTDAQRWLFISPLEYTFFPLSTGDERRAESQNSSRRVEGRRANAPDFTQIRQAEMEFAEVARSVLLVLPVRLLAVLAKPALVETPSLRDEAVICLAWREPAGEVHPIDLLPIESTNKCLFGDTIPKYCDDPVEGEGTPPMPPA